jgi:phosphoserine aminotransferase
MVPYNLMKEGGKAAYLDQEHGLWAIKTKFFGETVVVASSKKKITITFKRYTVPADANYFHCTSNNTILELK